MHTPYFILQMATSLLLCIKYINCRMVVSKDTFSHLLDATKFIIKTWLINYLGDVIHREVPKKIIYFFY